MIRALVAILVVCGFFQGADALCAPVPRNPDRSISVSRTFLERTLRAQEKQKAEIKKLRLRLQYQKQLFDTETEALRLSHANELKRVLKKHQAQTGALQRQRKILLGQREHSVGKGVAILLGVGGFVLGVAVGAGVVLLVSRSK